jgi:uncharacterized membrane protein
MLLVSPKQNVMSSRMMRKDDPRSAVEKVRTKNEYRDRQLRRIALLSSAGLADFIPITLYQLGVIRHLPDPPGKIFNSDKINGSREAQIAGIPDGVVSLVLYSATTALVAAALADKMKPELARVLIGGVLAGQAAGAAYYLYNMVKVQRKICPYCVTGALVNFLALVPLRKLFK